jgi:hypothetical protein
MPVVPESRVAVLRTVLYLFVIIDIHLFVRDHSAEQASRATSRGADRTPVPLPPPSVPLTIVT